MKKTLIALAALAAAGAASAQSSVTMFGIIDVVYTYARADGAGSNSVIRSDGYNSSRLGFRGTEDLGGGLSASFWLEIGYNADSGSGANTSQNNTAVGDRIAFNSSPTAGQATNFPQASLVARQGLTFNRRTTVSLAGNWGEIRLGRDYIPSFWNLTVFDALGTNGVGSALNVSLGNLNPRASSAVPPGAAAPQVRSSNSIGYFLPANLGGFYGQAMYALADIPNNCSYGTGTFGGYINTTGGNNNACFGQEGDGKLFSARLGWASGPFNVAGAWGRTTYGTANLTTTNFSTAGTLVPTSPSTTTTYIGDYTQWNIGGQWDLGMARLLGQYGHQIVDGTSLSAERQLRHWEISALFPVGAGEIRASYNAGKRHDGGNPVGGLGGANASNNGAKISQWAIGYVHNLSKRTAVYTTYANLKATGAALGVSANLGTLGSQATAFGGNSTHGFDVGLRHSF